MCCERVQVREGWERGLQVKIDIIEFLILNDTDNKDPQRSGSLWGNGTPLTPTGLKWVQSQPRGTFFYVHTDELLPYWNVSQQLDDGTFSIK
jgi:hypothetical protein